MELIYLKIECEIFKDRIFLHTGLGYLIISLVMPNGDLQDRFFYPTQTLMMNSYFID